jgi:dipeptidyl aminopeptidase/acylaminoacyl peptidase
MPAPATAPCGSWKSPVTSDLIVAQTVGLEQLTLDGDDVYWVEARSREAGRCVIVRRTPDGRMADVIAPPFNARTRAHEYGGSCVAASRGTVFFTHFADQRLWRQDPGAAPRPLTPDEPFRFADPVLDHARGRLICVLEDHRDAGREPANALAAVDLDRAGAPRILASGHDFFAAPRPSPEGDRLAWITWDHPDMPWDATRLWVADEAADGSLAGIRCIAGADECESILQPEWSPAGDLHFVSDRTGWWNLYRYRWRDGRIEPLCPREAEFGRPHWRFGTSTYAFHPDGRIVCTYAERGTWSLGVLDPDGDALERIDLPFSDVSGPRVSSAAAYFGAGGPLAPFSILRLPLPARGGGSVRPAPDVLRRSTDVAVEPRYVSRAEPIAFDSSHGRTAHAFFYPPCNPDFAALRGEKPPLLVMSHGGPTGATTSYLDLEVQFWTSRGIAVADVNYGGSTGFGRAYRRLLEGAWGEVDVEDCAAAARFLAERGDVDPGRLAITGGSAGGFTTLCALTFTSRFRAGASHYGVSDLEALARDTHKFESRYLDRLVGPYPASAELYRERSPIHHVDRLACPVIFLQGLEDKVVPPDQAERMVQALRSRKLPVAYVPFAGEQHGFRRSENIKRALDAELYFYSRVFGFALADPVEPVEIENL